jgi:hypothetical protein
MSDQPQRPSPPARTPAQLHQAQQQAVVTAALRGAAPRLYANAVALVQTASDISVVLLSNFVAVGVVSMSYISAKTLRNELDKAIDNFEKAIDQQVPTIEEVEKKLRETMENTDATRLR